MRLPALSARKWPTALRRNTLLAFLLLVALSLINRALITEAAPRGIVSLELAGTAELTTAMIRSWQVADTAAMDWARLSLYLDFAFIVAYLLFFLKLTHHWLLDRPGVREQQIGRWARAFFWTAAGTDVAENISLLIILERPQDEFWAMTSAILALTKFASLLCGLGFLIILRTARGRPLAL